MSLNGWRRLWIVLGVLWLVAVVSVAYGRWPTAPPPAFSERDDVRTATLLTTFHLTTSMSKRMTFVGSPPSVAELRGIPDFGPGATITAVTQSGLITMPYDDRRLAWKWLGDAGSVSTGSAGWFRVDADVPWPASASDPTLADATRADMRLQALRLSAVRQRQRMFVAEAFGAWAVPVAALYLLGWAIAWVRRGFATAG